MATMAGKVRHIRDADPSVELRAPGSAAVTADGQSAAKALNTLVTAYWDNNEIPWDGIGAQVVVSALDLASTDETYAFALEVSTDEAFTVPVEVARQTVVAVGPTIIMVDAKSVKDRLPGARFIRLKHDVGGTTPSLTYYAWLVHVGH